MGEGLESQNPDRKIKRSESQSLVPRKSKFLAPKLASSKGSHESQNIAKSREMKSKASSEKNITTEQRGSGFEDVGKIPGINQLSYRRIEQIKLDPRADQGPFGISPALPDEDQVKATLNSMSKVGESGFSGIRDSGGMGSEQIRK